jgi:hypothetical protein
VPTAVWAAWWPSETTLPLRFPPTVGNRVFKARAG